MGKLLFDSSSHLGQFCLNDEQTRIGCKNMQVALVGRNTADRTGAWTDLENGRVDRTIWKIPQLLQNAYYPFMDHFFSIVRVEQSQITTEIEDIALQLRKRLPRLSLYGRFSLATAIDQGRCRIYTLFSEMFDVEVRTYAVDEYGIDMVCPSGEGEISYADVELEGHYQRALAEFRATGMDLLAKVEDERLVRYVSKK